METRVKKHKYVCACVGRESSLGNDQYYRWRERKTSTATERKGVHVIFLLSVVRGVAEGMRTVCEYTSEADSYACIALAYQQ
jgi:hypothetical protein